MKSQVIAVWVAVRPTPKIYRRDMLNRVSAELHNVTHDTTRCVCCGYQKQEVSS